MRDPFSWSIPLGRLFGVTIRVHLLFPVVAVALVLRVAFAKDVLAGTWIDAFLLMGLLFVSVLAHEYGHCFGARWVDGDATEILMWPLGGLAFVEVPQTPRANFITVIAGPAVNVLLCLITGLLFLIATSFELRPPWNPFWNPYRAIDPTGAVSLVKLLNWDGTAVGVSDIWVVLLARLFWVNLILFLFNIVLIGFPMDGGRLLQCALWPKFGYRQATLAAVFAGFVVMFVLLLVAVIANELLPFALALFIYVSCKQQWILLETGGEDSAFGYDFSQGYTSLERDEPRPVKKRQSWWQRWLQRRAQRKMLREQEQREAEEARMDELLEKVQREGLTALTEEERRFLKRVSDKYRNRH